MENKYMPIHISNNYLKIIHTYVYIYITLNKIINNLFVNKLKIDTFQKYNNTFYI